jgi:hypothetical protein
MKKFILICLTILMPSLNVYSQFQYKTTNYYGVKYFSLWIYKSDEAEKLNDIWVDKSEIKNIIKFRTGLEELIEPRYEFKYDNISISIYYDIFSNLYSEIQYYGSCAIFITRDLLIPNSNYRAHPSRPIIFYKAYHFVMNNPIKSEMKKDLNEMVNILIDKFIIDFKSQWE